jgi:nucleoside-diphosphate-sugar epimerase
MFRGWLEGSSPVRSLLVSDVRDVAQAHINAATFPVAAHKRYIVGNEARLQASQVAAAIRARLGEEAVPALTFAEQEAGVSIPVGRQEVEASEALWSELGVRCRPTSETMADMAESLLRRTIPTHIVRA